MSTVAEHYWNLLFLDTYPRGKVDGTLDVNVYWKPTHTDKYLHFRSHHPIHVMQERTCPLPVQ